MGGGRQSGRCDEAERTGTLGGVSDYQPIALTRLNVTIRPWTVGTRRSRFGSLVQLPVVGNRLRTRRPGPRRGQHACRAVLQISLVRYRMRCRIDRKGPLDD
jgi:hypothetical protein